MAFPQPAGALLHPRRAVEGWEGAAAGIYPPGLSRTYTISRYTSPKLKSPGGFTISPGLRDVLQQAVGPGFGPGKGHQSHQCQAGVLAPMGMPHLKAHHLCSPCVHFSRPNTLAILCFQYFLSIYDTWFVAEALVVFNEECRRGQIFLCFFLCCHLKSKENLLAVS